MRTEAPVRCRSEASYPGRPVAVYWAEDWHPVRLQRSWREPGAICFRVRSEAGLWFALRYDLIADVWDVQLAS
ncbi:MAG: hypothetical protein J7M34_02065 [Anaerolineae bacterium]|nr:hypothetical protein [Anaerolineae bacterium]